MEVLQNTAPALQPGVAPQPGVATWPEAQPVGEDRAGMDAAVTSDTVNSTAEMAGVTSTASTCTAVTSAAEIAAAEAAVAAVRDGLAQLSAREVLALADDVERLARQVKLTQAALAGAVASGCSTAIDTTGARNTADFLRRRLHISHVEAVQRLTLAEHLLPRHTPTGEELPAVFPALAAAAAAGTLDVSSACRAITALEDAAAVVAASSPELGDGILDRMEGALTDALVHHDPDFLPALTARWKLALDPDGSLPSEEELAARQGLRIHRPYRGITSVDMHLTQSQAETLLTIIHAGNNPRAQQEARSVEHRTAAQRNLDTLLAAAGSALGRVNDPPATGRAQVIAITTQTEHQPGVANGAGTVNSPAPANGPGSANMPRPANGPTPANEPDSADPPGPVSRGARTARSGTLDDSAGQYTGPMPAQLIQPLRCDGDTVPVTADPAGRVLDVGRTQRLFTRAQRIALTARDKGCAFPDCTMPSGWCEAHHVTWWSDGGPTSVDNGVLLCSHHHHLIHQGAWTVHTNQGQPYFLPPPWIDPTQQPLQNHYHQPLRHQPLRRQRPRHHPLRNQPLRQ